MLDDKDIQKLKEVLATKEDLNNFSVKLLPREEFENFKIEIKEDINSLREMIQTLVVSVDKLVGAVDNLTQEYVMVTNKMDRLEKWLHQVADKVGIKLEY